MRLSVLFTLVAVGTLASCVSMQKYKAMEQAKKDCETQASRAKEEYEATIVQLKDRIATLENRRNLLEKEGRDLRDSLVKVRAELKESQDLYNNIVGGLQAERQDLVKQLEEKNQNLQKKELELNQALARVEEDRQKLNALIAELNATTQRVRSLERELRVKDSAVRALKDAVANALTGFDGLDIQVENRNGKVYVSLAEKLLFKSGSISVDPKGKDALVKLAGALQTRTDVMINVEGHTDDKPINSEKIKDNWDLSVLRATSIVRILTDDGGLDPLRIQASGKGQYSPVADNKTAEGRAKNRRTEIILTPKLDKILEIINN